MVCNVFPSVMITVDYDDYRDIYRIFGHSSSPLPSFISAGSASLMFAIVAIASVGSVISVCGGPGV